MTTDPAEARREAPEDTAVFYSGAAGTAYQWMQCRFCHGYGESAPRSPRIRVHIGDCPVARLEARREAVPPLDLESMRESVERWIENVRYDGDGRSCGMRNLGNDVLTLVAEVERLRSALSGVSRPEVSRLRAVPQGAAPEKP